MHQNPFSSHQNGTKKSKALPHMMNQYHTHDNLLPNQCTSSLVQEIDAPLPLVWSLVRKFDNPQVYKRFVRNCTMIAGDGGVGSVREVEVVTGMPAKTSTERLDKLDDDLHVMVVSIIGGDHRLVNYRSTITLHEDDVMGRSDQTVAIESYVVDIPPGNCEKETCLFADTIIRCNLRSLAKISERMAREDQVPLAY